MKSLTLVLCVIALIGAAASTFFYFQIGNTKVLLQTQLTQANVQTANVQAKLDAATAQINTLQTKLTSMDDDLGAAKSKLTDSDNHNVELARQVEQLNNQIAARDDAAKSLNNQIADLKTQVASVQLTASQASVTEIAGYKKNIEDLKAQLAQLQSTSPSVANTYAAGTTSTGTNAAPAVAGLSGQVVSVGMKNAFVVINVGAPQGVQVNQKFDITRGGNAVATAQVSNIDGDYSIAQITTDSLHGDLNKGDIATLAAK